MLCVEDRMDTAFFPYEPGSQCGMIHNDHLATPQKMTDGTGVVRWSADYKPFGEATIDQSVSTITNNLRLPGQYFDVETGNHYNYFRDYNPVIGRYIEADPIGIAEGENHLYSYVKSSPIIISDPLGLWYKTIHAKITKNALAQVNCSKAAADIAAANVDIDSSANQDPANAYKHAMSNGYASPPYAEDKFNWAKAVTDGMDSCKVNVLGLATHALQDSFAPAHNGFQPWRNHLYEYLKHAGDMFEGPDSDAAERATVTLLQGIATRCPCLCK